ncbi:interferon-related developmental regulator-domain-containing protein [Apodospora peruviana]|uniref:Interferon-related developmental regulator-domain-containing protein n=1 Tax=Apodospora peruviana TaxID=516989 RepID=A0AAE0IJX2_9PEZI|nr:interferon-related developmental regulator-domain-containing protein [Apodospora peruviana]
MHDLRKKALLESGKTQSRKARSKPDAPRSTGHLSPNESPGNSRPGSTANSRAGSRANSRPGSRYASEDEGAASDSEVDDVMTMSTNSASGEDALDGGDASNTWVERLQGRLVELQDRKRSLQSRESTLVSYLHLLRHHFTQRQIDKSVSDILPALLRSIRSGTSEEERSTAIKALTVTILTAPSETVYDHVFATLKAACEEAEEESIKVEAIHALGIAVTCGGGSASAAEEMLDFLIEIIESDGQAVGAGDNGAVVTAALQAWAFVASHMDDLVEQSENAMEVFMEQLDSTDPEVQTSAGSNIALLFEAARDYEEETGEKVNLQYNQHRIMNRMAEIVRDSSKAVSKKDRKHLRSNFSSIVTSLERGKGPGYSTAGRGASNPHTGGSKMDQGGGHDGEFQEFGYREKIRIHNQFMVIDTWSLHARVELLKLLLGGGLVTHWMENPTVRDILDSASVEYLASTSERKRW